MVGAVLIMIVFAALIIRGFQIALPVCRTGSARCWWPASPPDRGADHFNMGVVTGLLPSPVQPCPFQLWRHILLMLLGEVGSSSVFPGISSTRAG